VRKKRKRFKSFFLNRKIVDKELLLPEAEVVVVANVSEYSN